MRLTGAFMTLCALVACAHRPLRALPAPHRLLGRENTSAQKAWLRESGVRFGQ